MQEITPARYDEGTMATNHNAATGERGYHTIHVRGAGVLRIFHSSAYTAHQGGRVLWCCRGRPVRAQGLGMRERGYVLLGGPTGLGNRGSGQGYAEQ